MLIFLPEKYILAVLTKVFGKEKKGMLPSDIPECPSDLATLWDVHQQKRPQGARPSGGNFSF